MIFYNQMFNPDYVNKDYYNQIQLQISQQQYQQEQNKEVFNAVKACHDMLDAVKKLDSQHQQQAFNLCLLEIAKELNWK